jgi:hypothetical protein
VIESGLTPSVPLSYRPTSPQERGKIEIRVGASPLPVEGCAMGEGIEG